MTNYIVKVDFYLPKSSSTQNLMKKCQGDDLTEVSYDVIIGRCIHSTLVIEIRFSDCKQ